MITGKRNPEGKDRNKGRNRNQDHRTVFKRPLADPVNGLGDNCQNRCFKTKEKCLDNPHIAPDRIDPAKRHDRDHTGQNEQDTGNHTAKGPMH